MNITERIVTVSERNVAKRAANTDFVRITVALYSTSWPEISDIRQWMTGIHISPVYAFNPPYDHDTAFSRV
jgi:hypothetical protein